MSAKPKIINPPNKLREKVSGSGPISQEMIDRAELAVESLTAEFEDLMAGQIDRLNALYEDGVKDNARQSDVIQEIYQVAHDLRGQAGTFDYPLITRVGSSLCSCTDSLGSCDKRRLEVIRLHIDAIKAVHSASLKGDGGPVGQAIADSLEQAVQKVMG